MSEFWNERYKKKEFVYGTNVIPFFKEKTGNINPGRILLPAEGEGRNALYFAGKGWKVTAFDKSSVAKEKAISLLNKHNLEIEYKVIDFSAIKFEKESFDCIAIAYAHFLTKEREIYHKKLIEYLKPGGIILIQAFSEKQIKNSSGGPKNPDLLFTKQNLTDDFKELKHLDITERNIYLNEGELHKGNARILNVFGIK